MASVRDLIRDGVRKLGVNVHPYPSARHLVLDYPVSEAPRYGYGQLPHPAIQDMLQAQRARFEAVLTAIAARKELLAGVAATRRTGDPLEPYWNNGFLPPLDGAVLMHLLLERAPSRYVEIGSGNSTAFARHAIRFGDLPTQIISIDPEPRRGIDAACDRIIRARLEEVDQSMFDRLGPGDILFFDGSHRTFMDSDVTVFFLETLPRLPSGVLIHVHDIFWPNDYPPQWGQRYYSEQYMLALYLLHVRPEIVMANAYVSKEAGLEARAAALTPGGPMYGYWGVSFWFATP